MAFTYLCICKISHFNNPVSFGYGLGLGFALKKSKGSQADGKTRAIGGWDQSFSALRLARRVSIPVISGKPVLSSALAKLMVPAASLLQLVPPQ